jgi:hypothetical protein
MEKIASSMVRSRMEKVGSGMEKSRIRDGKKSDPGWKKGESRMEKGRSGMEKRRVREGKRADPGWKKVRSGIGKNIQDREKHPESATLVLYFMYFRTFVPLSQPFLIRKLTLFLNFVWCPIFHIGCLIISIFDDIGWCPILAQPWVRSDTNCVF